MSCCGNCADCGGCAREMELTLGEVDMLLALGQIPFLPVARTADATQICYLEDDRYSISEYSLILQCLEKKGLITLDFDKPLSGFDDSAYRAYPLRGSMALTRRGQLVLELIETQGVQ